LHCAWLLLGAVHCTAVIGGGSPGTTGEGPNGTAAGSSVGTGSTTGTGSGGAGSNPTGTGGSGAAVSTNSSGYIGDSTLKTFACANPANIDPGPSPLRLLSRTQYQNTLSGLFKTVPNLDTMLGTASTYPTAFGLAQAGIDQVTLGGYQAASEAIANSVVTDAAQLAALVPCAANANPAAQRVCAQSFVQSFGALAYRTPITDPADIARHMALYDIGAKVSSATSSGFQHGIQLVLGGMLQSPRFLYQVELGSTEKVGTSAVKLTPFEIAARLSYIVWDSPPDAAQITAAQGGQLATKDQVTAQLTRMLADPKGSSFVRRFLEGLTQTPSIQGVVKDSTLYPQWTANNSSLQVSVQGQARAFFDDLVQNGNGKLDALLTSSTVFVNKDLGSYYGTTGGSTFTKFTAPAGQASGILTLPAVLALQAKPNESWPIYRGRFVREALLCDDLPPPPPNIPAPPDVMPGVSTRTRLTEHEVNPSCSVCHNLMDPIGFGFEQFDAIGNFRTVDGGQPVNATGNISQSDVDGAFNGIIELGQKLAGSALVSQCVTRQWFRFTMSRYEQTGDAPATANIDGCSMKSIYDAFQAAGLSLNALPQALVATDAFTYRRPLDFQVSP
jgi:hypothetical protein